MNLKILSLGLMVLGGAASAADSYSDCVVANVARTRAAVRCDFKNTQSQIPGAYRVCQQILIDLATAPGADVGKVAAAVPALRAEADARVTALLKTEIAACGFQGDVTIGGGGSRFSMSVVKIN